MGDMVAPSPGAEIGMHVARWRERVGMSGRGLALKTREVDPAGEGVSHSYIAKLEAGRIDSPGLGPLDLLGKALGFRDFVQMRESDPRGPLPPHHRYPTKTVLDDGATLYNLPTELMAEAADIRHRLGALEENLKDFDHLMAKEPADAERVPINVEPGSITVHVHAEASAGRGAAYRLREVLYVPAEDAGRRRLIAVKIVGTCMSPLMLPGDYVIFEKVPDDQIGDGDKVLVTLLDQEEDGAYLVKYLHWARNGEDKVILTAEDGTRLEVPYDRVVIEGRYWRLIRE